jgi:hypothetical protein
MKEKLELASAQGHWAREENNGNWVVQDERGEVLWEFPPGFDEMKVMSAIRLGRDYELKAFNIGIRFGKEKAALMMASILQAKDNQIRSLEAMNIELSNQLDQLIKEG